MNKKWESVSHVNNNPMNSPKNIMRRLKAIFWDVDGTLADTEMEGHRVAFNQAFVAAKVKWFWDQKTYEKLLTVQGGGNRIKAYGLSIGLQLEKGDISNLHALKQKHYHKIAITGKIPLRIGVKRLVEEAKSKGIDQWIVTSSSKKAVDPLINTAFSEKDMPFNGLITADDVKFHKPNPEGYLIALAKSKVSHKEAIVIEDSIAGIKAAESANITHILTSNNYKNMPIDQLQSVKAISNHLGDEENPCNIYQGPSCSERIISIKYLELLINLT